jgi:hypothetical protein
VAGLRRPQPAVVQQPHDCRIAHLRESDVLLPAGVAAVEDTKVGQFAADAVCRYHTGTNSPHHLSSIRLHNDAQPRKLG